MGTADFLVLGMAHLLLLACIQISQSLPPPSPLGEYGGAGEVLRMVKMIVCETYQDARQEILKEFGIILGVAQGYKLSSSSC